MKGFSFTLFILFGFFASLSLCSQGQTVDTVFLEDLIFTYGYERHIIYDKSAF